MPPPHRATVIEQCLAEPHVRSQPSLASYPPACGAASRPGQVGVGVDDAEDRVGEDPGERRGPVGRSHAERPASRRRRTGPGASTGARLPAPRGGPRGRRRWSPGSCGQACPRRQCRARSRAGLVGLPLADLPAQGEQAAKSRDRGSTCAHLGSRLRAMISPMPESRKNQLTKWFMSPTRRCCRRSRGGAGGVDEEREGRSARNATSGGVASRHRSAASHGSPGPAASSPGTPQGGRRTPCRRTARCRARMSPRRAARRWRRGRGRAARSGRGGAPRQMPRVAGPDGPCPRRCLGSSHELLDERDGRAGRRAPPSRGQRGPRAPRPHRAGARPGHVVEHYWTVAWELDDISFRRRGGFPPFGHVTVETGSRPRFGHALPAGLVHGVIPRGQPGDLGHRPGVRSEVPPGRFRSVHRVQRRRLDRPRGALRRRSATARESWCATCSLWRPTGRAPTLSTASCSSGCRPATCATTQCWRWSGHPGRPGLHQRRAGRQPARPVGAEPAAAFRRVGVGPSGCCSVPGCTTP